MSYQCNIPLTKLEGRTDFVSPVTKEHECVALVQRGSGGCSYAPLTAQWRQGKKVMDAKIGDIPQGTVIATFDENGKYPETSRHAAIYCSHDKDGIWVYHQYKKGDRPGVVHKYKIKNQGLPERSTMDADYYYVVE